MRENLQSAAGLDVTEGGVRERRAGVGEKHPSAYLTAGAGCHIMGDTQKREKSTHFGRQDLGGRRNGYMRFRLHGSPDLLHRDHDP